MAWKPCSDEDQDHFSAEEMRVGQGTEVRAQVEQREELWCWRSPETRINPVLNARPNQVPEVENRRWFSQDSKSEVPQETQEHHEVKY